MIGLEENFIRTTCSEIALIELLRMLTLNLVRLTYRKRDFGTKDLIFSESVILFVCFAIVLVYNHQKESILLAVTKEYQVHFPRENLRSASVPVVSPIKPPRISNLQILFLIYNSVPNGQY